MDMAVGTDQSGSVRNPSGRCGIVGLKPTLGLVPYTSICPMEFTLDHVGPMARTVYDLALLLEVCLILHSFVLTGLRPCWGGGGGGGSGYTPYPVNSGGVHIQRLCLIPPNLLFKYPVSR